MTDLKKEIDAMTNEAFQYACLAVNICIIAFALYVGLKEKQKSKA